MNARIEDYREAGDLASPREASAARVRDLVRVFALLALSSPMACGDREEPAEPAPLAPSTAPLPSKPATSNLPSNLPSLPSTPPPDFETEEGLDALCSQFSRLSLPARDQPSPAERKALARCDSEALYYGIGVKTDFAAARKCAYTELDREGGGAFGGADLLMMLYANGRGVPTNFDLALKFACTRGGSAAGRRSTVETLWKARAGAGLTHPFELCDVDATPEVSAHCVGRRSRIAGIKRDERKAKAVMGLRSRELAFLEKAAKDYFETRVRHEIDSSDTTRAVRGIEEGDRLADEYVDLLEKLADPRFSPASTADSDARLAAFQARLLSCKELTSSLARDRGLTRPGLVQAQRAWAKYRDAWLALVAKARPRAELPAWRSLLSEQRLLVLETLPLCQKK